MKPSVLLGLVAKTESYTVCAKHVYMVLYIANAK